MDDEGTLGIQNWGRYFRPPPLKGNLGLQLMSNVGERMTMPFLSDSHAGNYPRPECGIPDSFSPKRCLFPPKGIPELSSMSIDYARDIWYHNNNENGKIHHVFSGHHPHQHSNNFGALLPEATAASAGTNAPTLPMLQPVDPPKQEKTAVIEDIGVSQLDIVPLKKRSKGQGRPFKDSKQTTAKKAPRQGSAKSAGRRRRSANKNLDMVINGIDLDLSGIPAPLCTCTGHPQQCYRWGAGGWQSACCTTSISMYPLPMNNKRRGARIAGRKMSQGAFKKVLEKLAGEGQDFSNPIDLKPFWAKHGTNKFVTIR